MRIPLTFKRRPGEPAALFALVDDRDAWASAIDWHAQRVSTGKFYAAKCIRVDGKPRTYYLHRLLIAAPAGAEVDHRNGDTLDCRRENLRVATHKQNSRNVRRPTHNTTGFKGVRRIETKKLGVRWRAFIKTGGKQSTIGTFATAEGAARAYDTRAAEMFGEFALLNFPIAEAA